ncbi:mitochondrial carrier family [Micractinium conductrix]|uniref:Mitochondrial carrier family n=1 Tax=Micractinium conductrix TaxID=554055 RepID=A0A2P6V596_9CHLO|nr:mitochondrial carrier family [Micractinium conductrix]|eukprot:PSC69265.1 mitochondrial carrier family [Micractinium conductrix]
MARVAASTSPPAVEVAVAPPPVWHSLAAGGASAIVSRLVTYPPDTVKSRLQVQGSGGCAALYTGTGHAFAKIAAQEGLRGFYRGFGGILLTVIPANMTYFSGYELGKRVAPKDAGLLGDLTAAVTAQTVAGVVFCPIDIVKQRVQTQAVMAVEGGASPLAAVRHVYANAGVPGFFKGYITMNALWLPWNTIYLPLYEAAKRRIYHWQLDRLRAAGSIHPGVSQGPGGMRIISDPPMLQVLPIWSFPLCSALSSATASIATHPIDVVKTRLQVLSNRSGGAAAPGEAPPPRLTAWQVCRQLYVAEGLRGFSRGLGARVATMSTGSAVTWLTYESVKRWLARRAAAEEGDVAAAAGGAAAVAGAAERSAAAAAGDSAAGDALPVRHKAEAS